MKGYYSKVGKFYHKVSRRAQPETGVLYDQVCTPLCRDRCLEYVCEAHWELISEPLSEHGHSVFRQIQPQSLLVSLLDAFTLCVSIACL